MHRRRWTGPLLVVAILAVAWAAVALIEPPAPPSAEPAPTAFSADRAWRHIEAISATPRPPGTPAHDRVRAYLLAELAALGLEVDTLTMVQHTGYGSVTRGALVRNVVARLPGSASTGALLLACHYDGVPLSPAAADGGIGVATVLETARALAVGERPRNDVVFLLTDSEELGMLGARAFARAHPWMAPVAFVANFEARGTSGPALMFETGPESGWAVRALGREGRRPVASAVMPAVYERMPNFTDFTVFRGMGLPGLNFAIGGSANWYHTPGDRPENLSRASLQHMGDNALGVARRVADADLGAAPDGERIYFVVPGLGLVGYGPAWVVPLAVVLVVGFVATILMALRWAGMRWWEPLAALLAALVAMVIAALLAHWLWSAVQVRHPELGALHGRALHREWPYATAVAALTTAVFTGLFGGLRRWLGLPGLALGALVIPVGVSAASAAALPAASYLLLWPSLAALAMVAFSVFASRSPRGETGRGTSRAPVAAVAGMVVGAVVVLFLVVPTVYLVHVMLGMYVAPLLAVAVAIVLLLILPLLDLLGAPHRAWLPVATLVAAGVLVAMGLAGAAPGPDRPAPANILHVQDLDSGTARWASPLDHAGPFTDAYFEGAVDTVSLAAVAAAVRTGRYRVAPAPSWPAPPALLTVLEDGTGEGLRRLRLRLSWDAPPMMVEVRPTGEASRLVEPAGGPLTGDEAVVIPPSDFGRWRLERWGLEWPLELVVETSAGEPVSLTVSARYPGLPGERDGGVERPADRMAVPAYRWLPTLSDVRVVVQTLELAGSVPPPPPDAGGPSR